MLSERGIPVSDNTQAIIKQMTDIEFYPEKVETNITNLNRYQQFPLTDMLALGTAFAPVVEAMQNVIPNMGSANSMLCRVTYPKGCHPAMFKNESAFLGTALNAKNQIEGQARINPVNGAAMMKCNPYMIIVAAALISISKKLDNIIKTQKDILAFLEQKEQAIVIGNFNFLTDVMNNYKFNWDNEKYCNNNHIKALDIKQETEQSIELYRSRISGLFNNQGFIHTSWDVSAKKDKLFSILGDYQTAVYLYAFSSYTEVLLLGNFDENYLTRISDKIMQYSINYRELFTEVSAKLEKFSKDSVASNVMRGIGSVSKFFGNAASNVPWLKGNKVDKGLIDNGENLKKIEEERNREVSKDISVRNKVDVSVFIDNLKTINNLYNHPVQILFDDKKLYIERNA